METITLTRRRSWPRPLIAVAITLGIGLLSGLAVSGAVDTWYAQLNKPWFAPPNWIFGPVWTVLYILMGVAAGLVWNAGTEQPAVKRALALYGVQLVLNAAWSILFFGLHEMGWALVEIGVLWVAIIATMFAFARVHRGIPWLMVPYICWVSFAMILNAAYVHLNG